MCQQSARPKYEETFFVAKYLSASLPNFLNKLQYQAAKETKHCINTENYKVSCPKKWLIKSQEKFLHRKLFAHSFETYFEGISFSIPC